MASSLLLLALALLVPASAAAVDPALCSDDGVTEVPPFAEGRDANGCVLLDPGNGDPVVPIQYEHYHKFGAGGRNDGELLPEGRGIQISAGLSNWGKCRTTAAGDFCTELIWDTTFDNMLTQTRRNADIMFLGAHGFELL